MKISVIVPVYNSEKYLHKCIDSILGQTYTNFELLLINDGSTDRSGEICDEYAVNDERVRVFHKENGGVSSARNVGIDNAKGKYICFIDSDDWVYDRLLESFFILENDPETALLQQGFANEKKNGESTKTLVPNRIVSPVEYSSFFYTFKFIRKWPFLHSKLFSNEIIQTKSIRFDEDVTYGEDLLFILDYLLFTTKIITVNKVGYHYSYQEDSLSKFYYPYESENKRFESIINKVYKLDSKFNFDDKVRSLHQGFYANYLHRVMDSLYRTPHKINRNERIKILKDKNTVETRSWFKSWTHSISFNMKIIKFLFVNKLIYTLDCYFVISTMLKKILRRG